MTSDDPYPTPPLDKYNDVTSPRKIGSILASKVSLPIEDIPTFKNKDFYVDLSGALEDGKGKKDIKKINKLLNFSNL